MSYRIRNWSEYTAGLKQHGSLTFWLDEAVLSTWVVEAASGKRGVSVTYSDVAIATFETIKAVYRQAGRQTEGLLSSLFALMGVPARAWPHNGVSAERQADSDIARSAEGRDSTFSGWFDGYQSLRRRRMEDPTDCHHKC